MDSVVAGQLSRLMVRVFTVCFIASPRETEVKAKASLVDLKGEEKMAS